MKQIVIVATARTGSAKFGGALQTLTAPEFGAQLVRGMLARSGIDPKVIDQTVFGSAWQAGVGPNPARITAVNAGVPVDSPAVSVNVRCGSSLQALIFGAQAILAGDARAVLVGGTESASQIPYALPGARWGYRMGASELVDLMHKDGFRCPLGGGLMGELTDDLAKELDIGRKEQDEFAVESHQKASAAFKAGKFKDEVVAIEVPGKKGSTQFAGEEILREDASVESMAKLKPVFRKDGGITAANACALCDAAAAQVLMDAERAKELGLKPVAKLKGYAFVGYEPKRFGLSPSRAIPEALKKAGMQLGDVDLIELNEAFAAQYLACERALKLDRTRVNVHGGAIALGHPVAATGSKILTTLIHALRDRNKSVGVASACIGGGNGVAVVVERV